MLQSRERYGIWLHCELGASGDNAANYALHCMHRQILHLRYPDDCLEKVSCETTEQPRVLWSDRLVYEDTDYGGYVWKTANAPEGLMYRGADIYA